MTALLPFAFPLMWLAITGFLGFSSGWYDLMRKYPNREESPLLRLRGQSGMMGGGVSLGGVLALSACPSGLRVGILRVFGLFSRDFFVPWEEIQVQRTTRLFRDWAELRFGNPAVGTLRIPARVANRLALASPGHWPEAGPFIEETRRQVGMKVLKEWAVATACAALFFIVVPRVASRHGPYPPIPLMILFPGTVFGVRAAFSYFSRIKR